ncbi:hypothetical protein NQZ68_007415 [Dissostichus eleginoides]|nr:hypothetical protein NQZ68_007415 [Dissostichus eleginoides]
MYLASPFPVHRQQPPASSSFSSHHLQPLPAPASFSSSTLLQQHPPPAAPSSSSSTLLQQHPPPAAPSSSSSTLQQQHPPPAAAPSFSRNVFMLPTYTFQILVADIKQEREEKTSIGRNTGTSSRLGISERADPVSERSRGPSIS